MAWSTKRRPEVSEPDHTEADDVIASALAELREAVERIGSAKAKTAKLREST